MTRDSQEAILYKQWLTSRYILFCVREQCDNGKPAHAYIYACAIIKYYTSCMMLYGYVTVC